MTLLLLAGTREAKHIAAGLAVRGIDAIASLAGATRAPAAMDIKTRIGGFGGADGFAAYMRDNHITAVIDATHPFASHITNRTAKYCSDHGTPYLQVLRPPWVARAGENWTFIDSEQQAASHIPANATVFLGTGRQTLAKFANLAGRRVICRQIDPPTAPFPFEGGEFLIGRPPFPVNKEKAIFKDLNVDVLIVKNAGGDMSATKLVAAREMGIPVIMINRPTPPDAPCVNDVSAALKWAESL